MWRIICFYFPWYQAILYIDPYNMAYMFHDWSEVGLYYASHGFMLAQTNQINSKKICIGCDHWFYMANNSINYMAILKGGISSKRSDSTIIFPVSCHSYVPIFAPRCSPRIFDNPIVIVVLCSIANNHHCMINLQEFSLFLSPNFYVKNKELVTSVKLKLNNSYIRTFWLIINTRLI